MILNEQVDNIEDCREKEIIQIKENYYQLKQIFGEDTAYSMMITSTNKWSTVNASEVKDILEKLKAFSLEEANKLLNFFKNTYRPGFKEAAERLEKRINAQKK